MDVLFIKKSSIAFSIIGLITLLCNMMIILFSTYDALRIFMFCFITASTSIMIIGSIRPARWMAFYQVIGIYVIIFICFFDDPVNIAGVFLSIIHYLLMAEYKFLKKSWYGCAMIGVYLIPVAIAIFLSGKPFDNLPPVYLLTSFFILFLKNYIDHKKAKDSKVFDKSIAVIDRLEPITKELLAISKRQEILIGAQAKEIEEFKNIAKCS